MNWKQNVSLSKKLSFLLLTSMLTIAGCGVSQNPENSENDLKDSEINQSIEAMAETMAESVYGDDLTKLRRRDRDAHFLEVAKKSGVKLDHSTPEACFKNFTEAIRKGDWTTAFCYCESNTRFALFIDAVIGNYEGMVEPASRKKLDSFFRKTIGVDLDHVENNFLPTNSDWKRNNAGCFLKLKNHGKAMKSLVQFGKANSPEQFGPDSYLEKIANGTLGELKYHGIVVSTIVIPEGESSDNGMIINFCKIDNRWLFNRVGEK